MTPHRSVSRIIERAEATVGPELEKELVEYFRLAHDMTDLCGQLVNRVSLAQGDAGSLHVCSILLARIVTDLQAVCHLIRRGYVGQALSLTGGMLELAHVNMYIGNDEKRAAKWLAHANPKMAAPWTVNEMVRSVAQSLSLTEEVMQREYESIYRDINMAKHVPEI